MTYSSMDFFFETSETGAFIDGCFTVNTCADADMILQGFSIQKKSKLSVFESPYRNHHVTIADTFGNPALRTAYNDAGLRRKTSTPFDPKVLDNVGNLPSSSNPVHRKFRQKFVCHVSAYHASCFRLCRKSRIRFKEWSIDQFVCGDRISHLDSKVKHQAELVRSNWCPALEGLMPWQGLENES